MSYPTTSQPAKDLTCPDCGCGPLSAYGDGLPTVTVWASQRCYEAGHQPVVEVKP